MNNEPVAYIEKELGSLADLDTVYNAVAPCGYHFGYCGEHNYVADTEQEALEFISNNPVQVCNCEGCVDWRRA